MFKPTALTVAAAALAFALPAQAGDTQSNEDQAKVEQPKEKRICRNENFVGSRKPVKTCKTAAEWDAADSAARRQFNERDRDGN